MNVQDLLSPEDAAKRMGVTSRTLRRWIADGSLTAYRMGPRLVRIDPADLDAILQPITPDEETQ